MPTASTSNSNSNKVAAQSKKSTYASTNPPCKGVATSGETSTPVVHSVSTSAVASSTSASPSTSSTSAAFAETPRNASTAHSSNISTPAVWKTQGTAAEAGGVSRGLRFTQPTVDSRAHLGSTGSRGSLSSTTPHAGATHTTISSSASTAASSAVTPEAGALRRPPSAWCSNPASSSETESQKFLPRSNCFQGGVNATVIEPGAAFTKGCATSSLHSSFSLVKEKKEATTGDQCTGNISATESSEVLRRRLHNDFNTTASSENDVSGSTVGKGTSTTTTATAAADATASSSPPVSSSPFPQRTTDPAPTIGPTRRKTYLPLEARDSAELWRTPRRTSPTPVPTPAGMHGTSIPSLNAAVVAAAALPPQHPTGSTSAMAAAPVAAAPRDLHSLPQSPVTTPYNHRAHSTPAVHRDVNGPATVVTQPSSSAGGNSTLSTPVGLPKAETEAKTETPSPPPPSRPTIASVMKSRVLHHIPLTEAATTPTSSASMSLWSAPPSPPLQGVRRHGPEGEGRSCRSTSPRSRSRSRSTNKTSVEAVISHEAEISLPPGDKSITDKLAVDGDTSSNTAAATTSTPNGTSTITPKVRSDVNCRNSSPLAFVASAGVSVPATEDCMSGSCRSLSHFASVLATDATVPRNVEESNGLAHSAPTLPIHRSASASSSSAVCGARSASERSRPPAPENLAALLEDLQVLRQREEAEARLDETAKQKQADAEEAEAAALRSHHKALAAVRGHSRAGADTDVLSTPLFPPEAAADGDDSVNDQGVEGRPSRATDTTGHAPITPRLRRRIEEEQQRELEMLRTITKERHPENVELLDAPDELIRELGRIDADMYPVEAEEVLRSHSSEKTTALTEEGEESLPVLEAADELVPMPSSKRPPVIDSKLTEVLLTSTEKAKTSANRKLLHPPPRDGAASTTSSEPRLCSSAEPDGVAVSPKTTQKTRGTNRPQRVSSVARSEAVRTNRAGSGSAAPSSFSTVPAASHMHARPPSSRSRETSAAENGSFITDNVMNVSGGAKFARRLSKAGVNSSEAPPPVVRSGTSTRGAVKPAAMGKALERRRRTLPEGALNGNHNTGGVAGSGPGLAGALSTAEEHIISNVQRRGSTPAHPSESATTTQSEKASAPQAEFLLPALLSPEEAAHTITIVFDLDETLCNNRCLGGTVLRPGAEVLLQTLRSLAPSPRYKLVDTRTRGQHATNRLYDQAMFRMGMTPLYRPRVAQRQANGGYHANIIGGSTGEARPATTKEVNPLRIELVLWTASEESLARRAMRRLDPQNTIFDEAIYRDLRWYRDSYYTKELSRLGRPMQRVAIIENSVESVIRNRQNAILVTSFITSRLDRQLFLVREVLRDWVYGMKSYLAYHQEHQTPRQPSQHDDNSKSGGNTPVDVVYPETTLVTSGEGHGDSDVVRHEDDNHAVLEKSHEEGGGSPVPPHPSILIVTSGTAATSRAEGDGSGSETSSNVITHNSNSAESNGDTQQLSLTTHEEPVPQYNAPAPTPKAVTSSHTLSNSGLGASTRSTGSAPRVLSAMARRAVNVVQFLHRHRLILAETNYINFQMTGEVMMRLQSTETALITATLPPAVEVPVGRTIRSTPCGPAPRTPRMGRVPSTANGIVTNTVSSLSSPPVSKASVSATRSDLPHAGKLNAAASAGHCGHAADESGAATGRAKFIVASAKNAGVRSGTP